MPWFITNSCYIRFIFRAEYSTDKDMTNLSKKYDQMNNNLDILDSQDISLKKQLEKDAAAFREEKFRPEPEQYTELLDTRIQIRSDFRDKLIEQRQRAAHDLGRKHRDHERQADDERDRDGDGISEDHLVDEHELDEIRCGKRGAADDPTAL